MKRRIYYIIFILILLLGFGLRAQEMISHNYLFLLDQGRDMVAVKGILYDNHPTLIGPATSLRGIFQGPLWYYLLAFSVGIFGGDPWGGVVLMVGISMLVLLVAYFWMKKLFGEKAAIVTVFLFAISSEACAAATYAWNPHPMWLLLVIYIFAFYSTVYKTNKFNILLWPTIGFMFHFQTALGVFVLLASVIYALFFERKIIFNRNFVIGICLFLFTFLPQIAFDIRHDFLMSRSAFSLISGSERGLFVSGEKTGYLNLIIGHADSLYGNFKSAFINDGLAGYIPNIFIIIILASIVFAFKKSKIFLKKESEFILFIAKILLLIILLTFAYPFPLRYWFLTGFQSFYLIILGLLLSKILTNKLGKFFIIILFTILLFYSLQRIDALYFNPPDDGGAEKVKGKLNSIDYIYKDSGGKKFGLLVFTPAVYTYAYDYLIWWYGQKKYGYLPHADKKGQVYLLIEPDRSKPWSYKGWLETVIVTGDVLKETILPEGFIIQKRLM